MVKGFHGFRTVANRGECSGDLFFFFGIVQL